jgi:hypothetical protein
LSQGTQRLHDSHVIWARSVYDLFAFARHNYCFTAQKKKLEGNKKLQKKVRNKYKKN